MKKNCEINQEIDLHGFWPGVTSKEICDYILEETLNFKKDNVRYARYIIGKGRNSKNGSVVSEIAILFLENLVQGEIIKSYQYEKNIFNNTVNKGAVIVKLF